MREHFWLKLKHGAPANPKWRMIAQKVGCPQGEIWTLYSWALDYAGQHGGSLAAFDLEEVAATTDFRIDELQRIWTAFAEKEIIGADGTIHNWTKHQGETAKLAETNKKVGDQVRKTSTPRTRKHRDRERQLSLMLPIDGTRSRVPEGVPAFPERVPDVPDAKTDDISAGCATPREEKERDTDSVSLGKGEANEKGASGRCALSERSLQAQGDLDPDTGPGGVGTIPGAIAISGHSAAETKAKRANLIKTLARWVRYSGLMPDKDEQAHRLLMLGRAEAALDRWDERTTEDKNCFDFLDKRARARPLSREMVIACEQHERKEMRRRMLAGLGRAA
jgi:hypothetical protein